MNVTAGVPVSRLSEQDVLELVSRNNEPGWLRERRLLAWRAWERLPLPDRETQLEWRRTDPTGIRLEEVALPGESGIAPAKGRLAPLAEDVALGAALRLVDGRVTAQMVCAEAEAQGVQVLPFTEALRQIPGVLERGYMTEAVPAKGNKFAALHAAFGDGGVVVYVPRGADVARPVYISQELTSGGVVAFPHVLVYAEEGSRVTVIAESYSEDTGYALVVPIIEVLARDGAEVRFVDLQRWGRDLFVLPQIRSVSGRDARATLAVIGLGGGTVKGSVGCDLAASGGQGELLGLLFPDEDQHYELDTLQLHRAPHTTSTLLFKTALEDRGVSISNGMVRIEPQAQKSDAFQENRNLLLSKGTTADPVPALEILANDVRCSHGTTIGPIDQDQAFYLQCRGLPRAEAERLIVHGFVQQVLDRMPAIVEPRVMEEIERKIHLIGRGGAA
ncbi:MAG: Fe-S cluster assembly protein SufD [Dehalococcoidia bacterium]|nr:Fe-S cluster assembly protein SufD [Dehalococcoidia bacterium]